MGGGGGIPKLALSAAPSPTPPLLRTPQPTPTADNEGQPTWAPAAPGKCFWPLWTGAQSPPPFPPICDERWKGILTPGLCTQRREGASGACPFVSASGAPAATGGQTDPEAQSPRVRKRTPSPIARNSATGPRFVYVQVLRMLPECPQTLATYLPPPPPSLWTPCPRRSRTEPTTPRGRTTTPRGRTTRRYGSGRVAKPRG